MSCAREFDVVVYGATGVTGQFVVEDLAKTAPLDNFTWAVAGRNSQKLRTALRDAEKTLKLEKNTLDNISIILADSENEDSIAAMCKRTSVLINVVGPYLTLGEVVVKSCIREGTSYVDAAAEAPFLELMQHKYHKQAEEAGVYIVGACGLASIPCELGVLEMKRQFKGDINNIESYLHIDLNPYEDKSKMKQVNIGTFISGLGLVDCMFTHWNLQKKLLRDLISKPLPHFPHLQRSWWMKLSPDKHKLCVFNVGCDDSSALRSQLMDYDLNDERPVQVKSYFVVPSLMLALKFLPATGLVMLLGHFNFMQNLIIKYSGIITFGVFSETKPTREEVKNETFKVEFYGKGWSKRLDRPNDLHLDPPNKDLRLTLHGPDPAYVTTSACLTQAAMCILKEKEQMTLKGVLTPGIAFKHTTLQKRLENFGITLSQLEEL